MVSNYSERQESGQNTRAHATLGAHEMRVERFPRVECPSSIARACVLLLAVQFDFELFKK